MSASLSEVLSFDLGGTKVLAAVVNSQGKILKKIKEPVPFEEGPDAVFDFLAELGRRVMPSVSSRVGLASAGPLDPVRGVLLDPTNMSTDGKDWGEVPVAAELSTRLGSTVILENDAAAAVRAEVWVGGASGRKNAIALTLGTGVGTGVWMNGSLLRVRERLHTEAGHFVLDVSDERAKCGCGNTGCVEAFLSGVHFVERARERFSGLREVSDGESLVGLAEAGNADALSAFELYGEWLAAAVRSYAVAFGPEVVVLGGGFSSAARYFLPSARVALERRMQKSRKGVDLLPELCVSELGNDAGCIGAASVAFGFGDRS